jgi:hypothetical protein
MPSKDPKDIARAPNPDRLWLYGIVGEAVADAIDAVSHDIWVRDPDAYWAAIGAHVLRTLKREGCLVYKDGEIVNLSRYADQDDPQETWLP